jgi:hypothetical protein
MVYGAREQLVSPLILAGGLFVYARTYLRDRKENPRSWWKRLARTSTAYDLEGLSYFRPLFEGLLAKRDKLLSAVVELKNTFVDSAQISLKLEPLLKDIHSRMLHALNTERYVDSGENVVQQLSVDIQNLHSQIEHVDDRVVRADLIAAANAKTRQLVSLKEIGRHKTRLEAGTARLEAFLDDLQAQVIRMSFSGGGEGSSKEIDGLFRSLEREIGLAEKAMDEVREPEAPPVDFPEDQLYLQYRDVWDEGTRRDRTRNPA